MYYTGLELKNFRSYKSLSVDLSPTVNIVVGPNATGKTNLLEAVIVASQGSSYRARDYDLIRFDSPWARVDTMSEKHNRTVKIKHSDNGRSLKEFELDGVVKKRLAYHELSPIVLFEPEHLRMIHGSPERRREYLDTILEQTLPGFKDVRRRYKRALAQRNQLLKQPRVAPDQLFVWDVRLSEYGAQIMTGRQQLIEEINRLANSLYRTLSGNKKSQVKLDYLKSIDSGDYASAMLRQLESKVERDRQLGYTSVGPHREDVLFHLNNKTASNTASRGELRTLVIMCKLVEIEAVEKARDTRPVLLLDDVFSELDSDRRRALTDYLKDYQTIITTTDADSIIHHFLGDYNVIPTKPS